MDDFELDNPFFKKEKFLISNKYEKLQNLNDQDIFNNFSRLFIICLKDNYDESIDLYKSTFKLNEIKYIFKNLCFMEANLVLIKNKVHKSQLVIFEKYLLELCDNEYINFNVKELVLPLFNIRISHAKIYLDQYKSLCELDRYMTIKTLNDFYNNYANNKNYINSILKNMDVSEYWVKTKNTKLNLTNIFINREFNLTFSQRIADTKIKNILTELSTMPKEGDTYLNYIYRKNTYVDISSVIKKTGYTKYKITNDLKYSESDIINLFKILNDTNMNDNNMNEYELYNLTINLLASKEYCHYILKNVFYYNLISDFLIKKYFLAFQYVIGYSWLTLYSEECIKKSFITEDDRFVFTINQANKLPYFPILTENNYFRYNPYVSQLISDDILNVKDNVMGISVNNNKIQSFGGVNDFNEFQRKLNIFMTGNESINIFKDVNMKNLGVTGSMIPACITKCNPLEKMFDSTDRYFKEYYCDSDLDIMCNLEDNFEFILRVNEFYKEINNNCKEQLNEHATFDETKVAALIVNEKYIKENIADENLSYEYILSNLNDRVVLEKFYKKYLEFKIKSNETYIKSEKWKNMIFNIYFNICNIENIRVIFTNTSDDWNKIINKYKNTKLNEEEQNAIDELDEIILNNNKNKYESFKEKDNVLFKVFENIKFKVKCSKLNHEFEIFKTKYPSSFFQVICNFHMPCVRGYYNGTEVYLLPSCITAAMTGINLDYKYFAGVRDPIEIVNKYRMRGYSIFLNDNEKIRLVSYSKQVDKWNNLYGNIKINDKNNISKIFGYLTCKNNFFRPRLINKNLYERFNNVDSEYKVIDTSDDDNNNLEHKYLGMIVKSMISFSRNENDHRLKSLDNVKQWAEKFRKIHNTCNLRVINSYGYINPIKKWYFEMIYETINS